MTDACPHCGKELSEVAILHGICPFCHKVFEVSGPTQAPAEERKPIIKFKPISPDAMRERLQGTSSKQAPPGLLGCLGLILFSAIFLASVRSCWRSSPSPMPQQTLIQPIPYEQLAQKPITEQNAEALCAMRADDEDSFKSVFQDVCLEVEGDMDSFVTDTNGEPCIYLDGAEGYDVMCGFPVGYTDQLKRIPYGTRVKKIVGTCAGEWCGTIHLLNCVFCQ